ncbi:MAG: hypothetical protein C4524_01185, partial [Candidatus Zixiibacteriota bacterium]
MKPFVIAAVTLGLAVLGLAARAEEGDSLWSGFYGAWANDYYSDVLPAGDGGFVMAGYRFYSGVAGSDIWLVKTDASGNELWSHSYGGSGTDYGNAVYWTGDGGYVLTGSLDPPGMDVYDALVMKVSAQGDSVWGYVFGGTGDDCGRDVLELNAGDIVVAGYTDSSASGSRDMLLLRLHPDGSPVWHRTFGGTGIDEARALIQTDDGGYMVAGSTNQSSTQGFDMYMVKTDMNGIVEWSRSYGGPAAEIAYLVLSLPDGGYLLAGTTYSFGAGNGDGWVVRTDAAGNQLWAHTYGSTGTDWFLDALPTTDGNYLLVGYTQTAGANTHDAWVVKMDPAGNEIWSRTYGGNGDDRIFGATMSYAADYFLAGWTNSTGAGGYDGWLLCLEGVPGVIVNLSPVAPPIQIPPAGGSFDFNVWLINSETGPQTFDLWTMAQLPNGSWSSPLQPPVTLTLPGGANLTRVRTQNVPAAAPAGEYAFCCYVGDYPADWDSSFFTFFKSGAADGEAPAGGWANWGEPFPGELRGPGSAMAVAETFSLSASPNPFNPQTTLGYQLS